MATAFSVIVDAFDEELASLHQLVKIGRSPSASAKTRIATIHATTLLLAAMFEEFIRESAREYTIQVVDKAGSVSDLPDALLNTAWKRTFEEVARSKPDDGLSKIKGLEMSAMRARPKIDALFAFIKGDITQQGNIKQNIVAHLIHNENNMRAGEINKLFKVSGLSNICLQICKQQSLKTFFNENDDGKTHGELLTALKRFFNRRNDIAHSLNSASSSAPEEVFGDIKMFAAFSKDLGATLEAAVG